MLPDKLRIALLLAVAFGTGVRGIRYVGASPNQISFVDSFVPSTVWAIFWFTVAAALVAAVPFRRMGEAAMYAAALLWGIWAFSFGMSWLSPDGSGTAWLSGSTMASFSAVIWVLGVLIGRTTAQRRR